MIIIIIHNTYTHTHTTNLILVVLTFLCELFHGLFWVKYTNTHKMLLFHCTVIEYIFSKKERYTQKERLAHSVRPRLVARYCLFVACLLTDDELENANYSLCTKTIIAHVSNGRYANHCCYAYVMFHVWFARVFRDFARVFRVLRTYDETTALPVQDGRTSREQRT